MEAKRQRIDRVYIERVNGEHKMRIEMYRRMLDRIQNDPNKQERLESQECVMCYGVPRIGGTSVTKRQCAFCKEMVSSCNTNVNVLCGGCAKTAGLCRHCGADIELTNRRKRELPEVV